MSRVVWLNGSLVDPADARLSIDDPAVRFGEGLRETMRGHNGTIPWLDRHLARLRRSLAALGLDGMPSIDDAATAATQVAAALDGGPARVRMTLTPFPTLLVEGEPVDLDPDETLTAATIRDTWHPTNRIAEHKTLSFLAWHEAERQARAAGADTAFLLDRERRLGEAATANVFCVRDGQILTTPIKGILPGITRQVVLELATVREAVVEERTWSTATEIFVTSAVRGVVPVVRVDDRALDVGPVTIAMRTRVAAMLESPPA
jgi:branched-chain amino acid aminotransferase